MLQLRSGVNYSPKESVTTVTATAARPTPTVVVARLTLSETGSAKRSPVVPLGLA